MDETAVETQQYARGRRKAISGSVVTEEQAASYTKTVNLHLKKLYVKVTPTHAGCSKRLQNYRGFEKSCGK